MIEAIAITLGGFAVVATGLSLLRSKVWWIRIWDFPRVQVGTVGLAALALWLTTSRSREGLTAIFTVVLTLAVAYQAGMIWRYTRLAPREVQRAKDPARERTLSQAFLAKSPLAEFCRALFNLNAFVYVD